MYCLRCGTVIPSGAEYCNGCGARVDEMRAEIERANREERFLHPDALHDNRSFDQSSADAYNHASSQYAPRTRSTVRLEDLPAIDEADKPEAFSDQKNYRSPSGFEPDLSLPQSGWNGQRVATLVILVVVAVLLAIIAFTLAGNRLSTGEKAYIPVEDVQQEEKDQAAAAAVAAKNEAFYTTLSTTYAALEPYRARIDSSVDEFEAWYLVADLNQRKESADAVATLKSEVTASRQALASSLSTNDIDEDNAYYDQYVAIDELLGNLLTRIEPLDASWKVDLTLEYPSEEPETVLAPLAEGTNASLDAVESYNASYQSAAPHKV